MKSYIKKFLTDEKKNKLKYFLMVFWLIVTTIFAIIVVLALPFIGYWLYICDQEFRKEIEEINSKERKEGKDE